MEAESEIEQYRPVERDSARTALLPLCGAALGVVFGDIGTSPLYAIRECFHGHAGIPAVRENIFGVMSLIFWATILKISIEYLILIFRADNKGEGGILALFALALPKKHPTTHYHNFIILLGLFGAALLYGDGIITPAISVLSAVEGLELATPVFKPFIVPITLCILFVLFVSQRFGTAGVGTVFGPVTFLWFLSIGYFGAIQIVKSPEVILAINPYYAVSFLVRNGAEGFIVLGAVFLVMTGGEALYADMGHFGKTPIRVSWFGLVLPALLLNYFGQASLVLREPDAVFNPFYNMIPAGFLYPMVVLATLATVIASQAMISGAFSLTRQAVQLGYSPRMKIVHTSAKTIGQIYIPTINWALMLGTLFLVLSFRSSANLAAAYGIAVSLTMVITTSLAYVVSRRLWGWSRLKASLIISGFLFIDFVFLSANMMKLHHGGWLPLALGGVVFIMLATWKKGREILADRLRAGSMPLDDFLRSLRASPPQRVPGAAVFMTGNVDGIPITLLHHLKHNKVLHQRIILLTLVTEEVPTVPRSERLLVEEYELGISRVIGYYGFMETPHVPALLRQCDEVGLKVALDDTTFYLGRETLLAGVRPEFARWRVQLFAFMSRNAQRATDFFRIPTDRVVELGVQIKL